MRRSFALITLSLGLTIAGAACGSDDKADTTTTAATTTTVASTNPGPVGSASSALCQAREDLRTSIAGLSSVDVVKNGTSAITDQLATIKTNLQTVRTQAGSDVQAQADAFQTSLDTVQTALSANPPAVATVVTGLRDVASTGATLLTSLGNLSCP